MEFLLNNAAKLFTFSFGTLLLQSLLVIFAFHLSKSFIKLELDKNKRGSTVLDFGMVLIFGIAISIIIPVIGTNIINTAVSRLYKDYEYLYHSYLQLIIVFSVILVTSYALFAERFKFVHVSDAEACIIDHRFLRLAIISLIITAFAYALVNAAYGTKYRLICEYASIFAITGYCFIELNFAEKHITELLSIKKTKIKCISGKLATLINSKLPYLMLICIIYTAGISHDTADKYAPFANINSIYIFLLVILVFQWMVVSIINKFISYTYALSSSSEKRSEHLLQSRSKNMIYICDFIILLFYFIALCYVLETCGFNIQKYVVRDGFITVVLGIFLTIMIGRIFNEFRDTILEEAAEGDHEHYAKLKTFAPTITILFYAVLVITAVLVIFANLGFNVTPILASFSIFGATFALAAQDVVKAFIHGVTLLIEKNLYVGDFVTINGMKGNIEKLSVRTIYLRGIDGCLHIIPYNCIGAITNHSKDYMRHSDCLRLMSYEDIDKATKILKEVVESMKKDDMYKGKVIESVKINGIQPFDLTGIKINWDVVTSPGLPHFRQDVYSRLVTKFKENNIKMPFVADNITIEEAE